MVARGTKHASGVQAQTAMLLGYGEQQAVLHTSIITNTPTAATVAGTAASLVIDGPFYQPGGFTLTSTDGSRTLRYDEDRYAHEGGLHFQAADVARRIAAGETGSPLRPFEDTVATLAVMDRVREAVGFDFAEAEAARQR